MNISYRWLKDYVATSSSPEELAQKLEIATCEVEKLDPLTERFAGLVIGKVLAVASHPNADKLRIATVNVGRKKYTIVCGAPNLAPDQTVVVALPGTTIYPLTGDPITIQEATIRGQKSTGMLCAADEIGLDLPSQGILVLDDGFTSGLTLIQALDLDDTILELEITPNRPDLLSYQGIAREISTLEKRRLDQVPIYSQEEKTSLKNLRLTVTVSEDGLCPRYSAVIVESLEIAPSPLWLQIRLALSGIKPINNVVDVTNYVMLESGQPLHAFDLDSIAPKKTGSLHVRSAKTGESITLIDGTSRELQKGDLVIADTQNKLIALAGIMGGKESQVTSQTSRILIEAATFDGPSIRRTSRRLGLRSEASTRFEKGLDTETTIPALKRALYLLQQESTITVPEALLDYYPKHRSERPRIHVSFNQIQQILGVHISASETKAILHHLGFHISSLTKSAFDVIPPSWRKDIKIPQDIIEELIRIWGFERLPLTLPSGHIKAPLPNTAFRDKMQLRRALAAAGLHETIHLSFTSATALQKLSLDPKKSLQLAYPLSQETEYLIPNHLIHFLENIAGPNIRETHLGLFEIGHVFAAPKQEYNRLSLILRGDTAPEPLYRQMKTILIHLFRAIGRGTPHFLTTSEGIPFLEAGGIISVEQGGKQIGHCGLVSFAAIQAFKIKNARTVLFAELDLDALLALPLTHISYQPPTAFPSVERDVSLVISQDTPFSDIDALLEKMNDPLLAHYQVTDMYTGKPLAADQKSITIRFTYNHPERTLTDKEVNHSQAAINQGLTSQLQAHIN